MALTELQKRKFKAAFDSLDLDGSGKLTDEDFQRLISNITEVTDSGMSQFLLQMQWDELKLNSDTDNSGEVTLDEWYAYHNLLLANPSLLNDYVIGTLITVLNTLDSDGDNKITLAEYTKFVKAFNVEASDAEMVFKKRNRRKCS